MTRLAGLATALATWLVVARTWAGDAPPPPSAPPPGAVLPRLPDALPASPLPPPTPERVRAHLEAGDVTRAIDTAARLVAAARPGRERDAANMVLGMLHREAGRHNLASEAFTQVRAAKGPLAPMAAFHEAEQDLLRGRPHAAIAECEALARARPDGDEADECGRIVALAHATAGEGAAARAAARRYDDEHEHGPISEQVEVRLARRWTTQRPELAVQVWRQLALHHDAPLAGRTAERELARLAAAGVPGAGLPDEPAARMARAVSMRDSGRLEEAWALFTELAALGATDPTVARWVAENEDRFAWRTRQWDTLAADSLALYEQQKNPGVAWNRYKILVRGGRFSEAADWALRMQAAHGRGTAFYRSEEEIARAMMLAGRYADAVSQLDAVARRGGWSGRRAAALAAFCTLSLGDPAGAITRYDAVLASDADHLEARYWRARAHEALGHAEAAAADREVVLRTEPWSWYATLFRQDDPELPAAEPWARDGTWPGRPPPPPPPVGVLDLPTVATTVLQPGGFRGTQARPVPGDLHLSMLAWPWTRTHPTPSASASWERPYDPTEVPPGYRPSAVWDPVAGLQRLRTFADGHLQTFPELAAIADLATAGLHEESGTRFSAFYKDLRKQSSRGDRVARKLLDAGGDGWRTFFLATHDHHDVARSLYDTWTEAADPASAVELQRLGYPLAHGRYVWSHAQLHGVDPSLVLGLMRQESTYDARAVSRAGARGPMQIMPRTGHLLADLAGNELFNAGDLSDPELAIEYGIWYLGLLLDRFDGVYPLAVASYNGGPHNVSSWLQGPAKDLPMDRLVEHLVFRETRDYVKKVSTGYAAYVALYAPPGSAVTVPRAVRADRPEIVDF